jgi:hypothetical protein
MENTPLAPEERRRILDEIHQRQNLEQQAVAEQKAALKAEAERAQREELARVARTLEEQRKENIRDLLKRCSDQLERAIASFEEGDETETYRLLVRVGESRFSASERLARPPERPTAVGGLPTLKVKRAGTAQGWCIINAEDLLPADEIIQEDSDD